MDALAFDSVLLVGHSNGGFGGCEKQGQGGGVWNEGAVRAPEGDVRDTEGNSVGTGGAGLGVFTDSQQVVEGDVNQISCGKTGGATVGCCPGLVQEVLGQLDRHSQLWF